MYLAHNVFLLLDIYIEKYILTGKINEFDFLKIVFFFCCAVMPEKLNLNYKQHFNREKCPFVVSFKLFSY